MWALVGGSRDSGVRIWGNFQSSSTRSGNDQGSGWAAQGIATQSVSQFAERPVRQLATKYAQRGAFSERTNEMAAVAHPVGMEVVTARCRNREEQRTGMLWGQRVEEKWGQREYREPGNMAARATHAPTYEVVRQTAPAGQAEKRRQRQVENKRYKEVNRRAKVVIQARQKKAEEDAARAAHNGEVVRQ